MASLPPWKDGISIFPIISLPQLPVTQVTLQGSLAKGPEATFLPNAAHKHEPHLKFYMLKTLMTNLF